MALELMGRNIFCDNHDYGGSHRKNKKGDHVIHINLRDVFVNYNIILGGNKEGTGGNRGLFVILNECEESFRPACTSPAGNGVFDIPQRT